MRPRHSIIAAIGKDRGLGKGNKLLFHIPKDMQRFRRLTVGHAVIMGRKTFESIGRPLPNRTNIVVSRHAQRRQKDVIPCVSFEDALRRASLLESSRTDNVEPEICIIGGGQIYAEALPLVDRLYLTVVDAIKPADTFFPEYEDAFPTIVERESGAFGDLTYTFLTLAR